MRSLPRFVTGISLFVMLTSLQGVSASPAQQTLQGNSTISVSGDAQINVVPDKVLITLGVETTDTSLKSAQSANDDHVARVLAVTQSFKIEAKDVQTDYISIQPKYDDYPSLTIVGYSVRKSMVITLRDISKFDDLLSAAVDAGANVVQGIQFLTSDLRKYRDQARDLAIKAAREKADALAAALGQKAGKAITISEQQNSWYSYYNSFWGQQGNQQSQNVVQNAVSSGSADPGDGDTTAPGQIKVTASVSVIFELTD